MKNFYDFYKLCKNPLYDDEVLKKVLKAYREMAKYNNSSDSFYRKIETIGAENKKNTPPPQKEKDLFWSALFNRWKRNILRGENISDKAYNGELRELVEALEKTQDISTYNEFIEIIRKYPIIDKYKMIRPESVDFEHREWNYVLSSNINGTRELDVNSNYRLYINSEASDTYQILAGFIGECSQEKIPYYLKFIEDPKDYQERADSIVIWADEKTLFKYYRILNQLQKRMPNVISRCSEPPILTMKINSWIGFGEEPNSIEQSYTSARSKILVESISNALRTWIIENSEKKVNINKLDFPVKQYIAARSVKDGFDSMKKEIKTRPKSILSYGVNDSDLNRDLYIEVLNDIIDDVIPAIESDDDSIDYNKNGKNLRFYFRNSLNDVLDFVMNSDVDRKLFFEKIRENIKQNSKKYEIDEEKFIFNDGYLEQIKRNEDCERT